MRIQALPCLTLHTNNAHDSSPAVRPPPFLHPRRSRSCSYDHRNAIATFHRSPKTLMYDHDPRRETPTPTPTPIPVRTVLRRCSPHCKKTGPHPSPQAQHRPSPSTALHRTLPAPLSLRTAAHTTLDTRKTSGLSLGNMRPSSCAGVHRSSDAPRRRRARFVARAHVRRLPIPAAPKGSGNGRRRTEEDLGGPRGRATTGTARRIRRPLDSGVGRLVLLWGFPVKLFLHTGMVVRGRDVHGLILLIASRSATAFHSSGLSAREIFRFRCGVTTNCCR